MNRRDRVSDNRAVERSSWRAAPFARIAGIATLVALSAGFVLQLGHRGGHEAKELPFLLHWLRDSLLSVPLAIVAILAATALLKRLGRTDRRRATFPWSMIAALFYALLLVPGSHVHAALFVGEHAHAHTLGHAISDASSTLPTVVALLLALAFLFNPWAVPVRRASSMPSARRRVAEVLVVLLAAPTVLMPAGAASAAPAAPSGLCGPSSTADRHYDVVAASIDIPFNRWGDHNENGQVFVLASDEAAMVNWYVPLGRDGSGNPDPNLDPAGAGNRRLRPRPLILRANAGECISVTLTNHLNQTPSEDLTQRPRVSLSVNGASYDPLTSDGGHVGYNPDATVGAGEGTKTYWWRVPAMEGVFFFRDQANAAGSEADGGSQAHGLYGALAVEPAGSYWLDNVSGRPLYTSKLSGESYRDAIIVPASGPAFRESVVISQDEFPGFAPRSAAVAIGLGFAYGSEPLDARSTERNRCADCVGEETWLSSWVYGDPALVKLGSGKGPWFPTWHPDFPGNNGVQVPGRVVDQEDCGLERNAPALGSSCWVSNVLHSNNGDPTKVRFLHVGPKETHVFHLHAHQWLTDPQDVGASGNTPGQPDDAHKPDSMTIDSQTYGPGEGFTADLLFGAGSKPGTAGDSIFHCHLYPHFADGFWYLLRVHDVYEGGTGITPDAIRVARVAPLPDRTGLPAPTEFAPGYPRAIPGVIGWRAPQPVNSIFEPNGAIDIAGTVAREDLSPAVREVAGRGLRAELLDAVQTISTNATGGSLTLTFAGQSTGPLPYNASAAAIEGALEALGAIEGATVTGSGTPASPWRVLLDLWTKTPSLAITANAASLTGVSSTVTITPSAGFSPTDAVQVQLMYQLAIERYVTRSKYDPTYVPGAVPAAGKTPLPGAPYTDPCAAGAREITYNVSVIQLDVLYNDDGWHDTQGRILVLDEDVDAVLSGAKAPEPLFFRANAGDCINFNLTNRLPNWMGMDDFLALNQTNMMGQHIHLVKFDVTASDGASNGWNYQQATFTQEQTEFKNAVIDGSQACGPDTLDGAIVVSDGCRIPLPASIDPQWACSTALTCPLGQTLTERWFADYELRTAFSHDHHFPAVDQNRGQFAALVVEPAGHDVRDPFSGEYKQPINDPAHGSVCGTACVATAIGTSVDLIGPAARDDYREFGLAIADFVSLYRPCGPLATSCSTRLPGQEPLAAPGSPEHFPEEDPGVMGINYRSEHLTLRNTLNGQPVDPAYIFSSTVFGDPSTPLLQAYSGDPIRVRLMQGAQEEQHVVQFHGLRWREEPDDPGSPLVNAKALGVSDAFNFELPYMDCGYNETCQGDYLYSGASTDEVWNGAWGILRVLGRNNGRLLPLPDNAVGDANGYVEQRPTGLPPRRAEEPGTPCPPNTPLRRFDVVAVDTKITYNEAGDNDPYGLVYAQVLEGETPQQAAQRVRASNPTPMVLRATEGECLEVTLTNMIDPAGPFAVEHAPLGAADSDPRHTLEPLTGTPGGLRVSLHPSLVMYDVRGSDGATIGYNPDQTAGPGQSVFYRWFADDVSPGELGAINLTDYGDVRGHRHHGLFAGLVIEPKGSTVHDSRTGAIVTGGDQVTVRVAGQTDFRELVTFFQDGLNLRDKNGVVIPDLPDHAGPPEEGPPEPVEGDPLDSEDKGEKGFNYRNAPYYRRLGIEPTAPLDNLDGRVMADVRSSTMHGDPWTPILRAYAGDQLRIRILQGADKPRQNTYQLAGHSWARQPFDNPATTELVGSVGGISVGRALNLIIPKAGGDAGYAGDYEYYSGLGFRHRSGGLWGLLRVYKAPNPSDLVTPLASVDSPYQLNYAPLNRLETVSAEVDTFADTNKNRSWDRGEAPIGGVNVQLRALDGHVAAQGVTSADGRIRFQVDPGPYDAIVTPLFNTVTTLGGTDPANRTIRIDAQSTSPPVAPFGFTDLGSALLTLFNDLDESGTYTSVGGDQVLANRPVTLVGPTPRTATSDANGLVRFDGLTPGTYTASVTAPPLWTNVTPASMTFTVSERSLTDRKIGFVGRSSVGVNLFNDANSDGVRDPDESPLANLAVMATKDVGGVVSRYFAVTNSAGIVNSWRSATGAPVSDLPAGGYAIAPTLRSGWSYASATATTTSDGVTSVTPGFTCPAFPCATTLVASTSQVLTLGVKTPSMTIVARPFADISNDGIAMSSERRLSGWNVTLTRVTPSGETPIATGMTNGDGQTTFTVDPGDGSVRADYRVRFTEPSATKVHYRPTPASTSTPFAVVATPAVLNLTATAGEVTTAQRGFIQLSTIGATVFEDLDLDGLRDPAYGEPLLANRTVRLYDSTGRSLVATSITDATGNVAFNAAAGRSYQLEVVVPLSWQLTAPTVNGRVLKKLTVTADPDPTKSVMVTFGQYNTKDITPPQPPKIDPTGGTYVGFQAVTLAAEKGARIRYTLDGTAPTATWGLDYTTAIMIGAGQTTLKTIAVDRAGNRSSVATELYVISFSSTLPQSVSLSPTAGTIDVGRSDKGSVTQLAASDNNRWSIRSSAVGARYKTAVVLTVNNAPTGASALALRIKSMASGSGSTQKIEMLNMRTNVWELFDTRAANTIDTVVVAYAPPGDVDRFRSASGQVRVRVSTDRASSHTQYLDQVQLTYSVGI